MMQLCVLFQHLSDNGDGRVPLDVKRAYTS